MAKTSSNQSNLLQAKNDSWGTPSKLIHDARSVMGGIDTDPCTSEFYNQHVIQAELWYTEKTNGLINPWRGNVWLNPPYSKKFDFIQLAHYRYLTKQIDQCIMLLTLNTLACKSATCLDNYPVCIHRGRISFVPLLNQENTSNTVNSIFVYMGSNVKLFEEVFAKYGKIR